MNHKEEFPEAERTWEEWLKRGIDTISEEEEAVCPFCKTHVQDSWELPEHGQIECEECGSIFEYDRELRYIYEMKPIQDKR